jgi:hypothetical protein
LECGEVSPLSFFCFLPSLAPQRAGEKRKKERKQRTSVSARRLGVDSWQVGWRNPGERGNGATAYSSTG